MSNDVYLKDEGELGSLFFGTPAAKAKAEELGIENQYGFMKNFEGEVIYRVDFMKAEALRIAKVFMANGFKVEMEYGC